MSSTLDAILEAIDEVKKEKNQEAEDVEELHSDQNQQQQSLGELNILTTKEASPGAVRREMNAARKRIARLNETPEEKEKRRAKDAERNRRLRSQETDEQKARRREKNAARGREKRRLEATKEAELIYKILGESSPNIARKELDAARKREKRKVETEEERAVRLAKNSERNRILRQNESEEQRQRRLESNARRGRERRKTEASIDPESRKIRLQLNAERERARRHAKAKNSDYYEKMMKEWSGKGYIHPTRSSAGSTAPSYASSRTSDGASPSLLDIKQEVGSSTVDGSTREGSIEMNDEKKDIWQKLLDMTGQATAVPCSSEDLVPDIPAPDSPVDEAMDSEQASIWEQLLDMAERSQKTETPAEPQNKNSSSEPQPVVQLFSENMQSLVFPGEKDG